MTPKAFLEANLDRINGDLQSTIGNIGRQTALKGEKGFVVWLLEEGGPANFYELRETLERVAAGSIQPPGLALARMYARDLLPRTQGFD
jgi:hypothetical protein